MRDGSPPRPEAAPDPGASASICPHCWMVNPGPFRLCSRCGASMETYLQESGGLRRTAPVQSPVPVSSASRLTGFQRVIVGCFVAVLALGYLLHLFPGGARALQGEPLPIRAGMGR